MCGVIISYLGVKIDYWLAKRGVLQRARARARACLFLEVNLHYTNDWMC